MANPESPPRSRGAFFALAATVVLCLAALRAVFAPFAPWLTLPLVYDGDGLWNPFVARTVAGTSWYGANDALGAPLSPIPCHGIEEERGRCAAS